MAQHHHLTLSQLSHNRIAVLKVFICRHTARQSCNQKTNLSVGRRRKEAVTRVNSMSKPCSIETGRFDVVRIEFRTAQQPFLDYTLQVALYSVMSSNIYFQRGQKNFSGVCTTFATASAFQLIVELLKHLLLIEQPFHHVH